MNQLNIFKLLIPIVNKQTQVMYNHHPHKDQLFKNIHEINIKASNIIFQDHKFQRNIPTTQIQIKTEEDLSLTLQQSDDQQHVVLKQSAPKWQRIIPMVMPSYKFKKNQIEERVSSMQYEANNPCEDKYTYQQLKSIDAYTISIFDGHGGPELAEYSKAKINHYIDSYLQQKLSNNNLISNIGQLIKESLKWSYQKIEDSFYEIYEQQMKLGNKKLKNVGTCAITAVVHNDRVYVGNSGDSQAIFILREGADLIRSQKANERLSVNNKNEREKILKDWSHIDENIIVQDTTNCYYLKGRLQPTRTIGDYYLKKQQHYFGNDTFKGPYLSCEPNIDEHKITKAHQFMVIASDGVWDVLSKNDVMNYLLRQNEIDLTKTCYSLNDEEEMPYVSNVVNNVLQKASECSGKSLYDLKRMQKGMRRNYHDDITITVINLENQLAQ